jgi:hypothetical protein
MRKASAALAVVLMVVVAVEIYLAGAGAFDTAPRDESFQPHRVLGLLILLLAILLTVIGAVTRMPGRLIGMAGLVAGLALLQRGPGRRRVRIGGGTPSSGVVTAGQATGSGSQGDLREMATSA